jgi:predicted SAM-dependent methyltransferase
MEKIVKVNLGCGLKAVKGWVNMDKSWKIYLARFPWLKFPLRFLSALGLASKIAPGEEIPPELDVRRHDVAKGLPFKDNSVDYVYTSHMLEHLNQEKANFVLEECYRTLKKGGGLRVIVPDLGLFVEEYIRGKQAKDATATDRLIKSLGLHGSRSPKPFLDRLVSGKGHQWMYDFESLAHRLSGIGFKDVKRCQPRQGEVPDLHLLDEGELHPDSLYIEAKK